MEYVKDVIVTACLLVIAISNYMFHEKSVRQQRKIDLLFGLWDNTFRELTELKTQQKQQKQEKYYPID